MNDSQVSLSTRDGVKEDRPQEGEIRHIKPSCHQLGEVGVFPGEVEDGPQNICDVQNGHLVREDVGVAGCCEGAVLPPPLVTQVEDHNCKREDDQTFGDDEGGADEKRSSDLDAVVNPVDGGGVDRHVGTSDVPLRRKREAEKDKLVCLKTFDHLD